MIEAFRVIAKKSLVRNVMTVATGAAVTQAIAFAFTPLITRLYGPEIYGLLGVFTSAVGLLVIVAALGYPAAIVLPRSDADARLIAQLSMCIAIFTTILLSILLAVIGHDVLILLNAEAVGSYIYILPFAVLISVISSVLGQWLIRNREFKTIAVCGVAGSLLANMLKIALGYVNPTALTLISTSTFGELASSFLMFLGGRRASGKSPERLDCHESDKKMSAVAKQHIDFPLLRTPQNLLNAISQSAPVLLMAGYFGAGSAGQYALAIAVLGIPANLIGSSVMAVFYPYINESIQSGKDARAPIIKATIGMAITGMIPFLAVILIGPTLYEWFFGDGWRAAGVYAQLLSPWLFFQYINKPAVAAIPALRIQSGLLIYEIFSTGSKIFAIWLGFVYCGSDIAAVALYSFFGTMAYLWLIAWVVRRCGKRQILK